MFRVFIAKTLKKIFAIIIMRDETCLLPHTSRRAGVRLQGTFACALTASIIYGSALYIIWLAKLINAACQLLFVLLKAS